MASRGEAERDAAQELSEKLTKLASGERRETVLRLIRSAHDRLVPSLVRCDD